MNEIRDEVITTVGRMNPPTAGHGVVGDAIKQLAAERNADHVIFGTPTTGDLKNPLPPEVKQKHMKIILGTNNVIVHPSIRSPIDALHHLHNLGYKKITLVAGGSRAEEFENFRKYFGKKTESKKTGRVLDLSNIHPDNFTIHKIERDADSDSGETEISHKMIDPRTQKMHLPFVSASRMRSVVDESLPVFSSMLPPHVSDAQAKELQKDLRYHMRQLGLNEEVSAQTRMKLSRIAKRTGKRRAMLRKARRSRRKGMKILKKRAKQDIKNQLRHKLYKGRWQKLGFSTRANIDKNINRRRRIADQMVKRIMPDIIRGESERLNRLNKESFEFIYEAARGSRKTAKSGANSIKDRRSARGRKQRQRARDADKIKSGNVTGSFAIVRANSGKYAGRTMIVDKDSYNPAVHSVVLDPKKFNLGAGQKILDDDDFIQTDSSIKLYGEVKGEDTAKLKKVKAKDSKVEFKGSKKDSPSKQQKKARESMLPKEPGKWDPVPGDIQPKKKQSKHCMNPTSHDANIVEPGMALFANMANGISPEEQVKMGLMDENTAMAILKNPHGSLHPALQKMANVLQKKYGSNAVFKVTGRKLEGTKLNAQAKEDGIVDTTPKTDVQVLDKTTGKVIDNASVKCGPSQASSGNWQDSYTAFNWVLNNADQYGVSISKETTKRIKDIIDYLSGNEYGGYTRTQRGPSGLYTQKGILAGQDAGVKKKEQANKKLTDLIDKAFSASDDAKALYNLAQMTGLHKFEQGNDAIASSMIAVSHDGSQVKIVPITLDLAKRCKTDIASRIKSNSSASSDQEKEWAKLKEQASKSGKKLTDLDDFRPYSLRNTIRVVINEINLEELKDDYDNSSRLTGNLLFKLLTEKKQNIQPPPQPTEEELKSNFEELKELAKENPMEVFKLLGSLFDYDDLSPTVDWLDIIPPEGYTFNRVYINGNEFRVPVEIPVNYPEDGVEVSALGESFLEEKRNYRKEYDNYHSKPEQRKNRAGRVKARRLMMRIGKVRKGDGKDVDHKDGNPKNNGKHNLRVRDKSKNRADND